MPPYKSERQRAYMNAAAKRGDVPKKVVEEFNEESRGMSLPYSSSRKGAKKHGEKRSKDGKRPYPHKRPD